MIDEQPSLHFSPNHSVSTTIEEPVVLELSSTPSSSKTPSSNIIPPSAESNCPSKLILRKDNALEPDINIMLRQRSVAILVTYLSLILII